MARIDGGAIVLDARIDGADFTRDAKRLSGAARELDIAVRLADGTIIVTDNQFVVGSSNNIVGSFTGIEVPTGASIAIVNATEYN